MSKTSNAKNHLSVKTKSNIKTYEWCISMKPNSESLKA